MKLELVVDWPEDHDPICPVRLLPEDPCDCGHTHHVWLKNGMIRALQRIRDRCPPPHTSNA